MSRGTLLVGAHVICFINGKTYGLCDGFRFTKSTPRTIHHGLDDLMGHEIIHEKIQGSGAMTLLPLLRSGHAEGAGMAVPLELISTEQYFSILLIDKRDRSTIFRANYCAVASQSLNVAAKQRANLEVSFVSLDFGGVVDETMHRFQI